MTELQQNIDHCLARAQKDATGYSYLVYSLVRDLNAMMHTTNLIQLLSSNTDVHKLEPATANHCRDLVLCRYEEFVIETYALCCA